jgi:ubiquinone/menaquinone biosynthesis C-methylase UbiE
MNVEQIIVQNTQIYNKIADHFSDTRSFLWADLASMRDFVKEGDKVLDIGCGNGRLYQLFSSLSSSENKFKISDFRFQITFTGLDISRKLIQIAKEKNPECNFVVGDMRELPFEDESFDVVFNLVSFHHLPDKKSQIKALKELKRVLKPGGKAILLNWNAYSDWVKNKITKGDYEYLGNQLFRVPWKKQNKKALGDRIYYGFKLFELEGLFKEVGLELEYQYFFRHGEVVGVEKGMNIVSVLSKL